MTGGKNFPLGEGREVRQYWSLVKGDTVDKEEPGNLTSICSELGELFFFFGCKTENKRGFSERLL